MIVRTLGRIGRTLIAAGIIVFLFLAYLLWGTNIHTAGEQRKLEKQYQEEKAKARNQLAATTAPVSAVPPGPVPTAPPQPITSPVPAPDEGGIVGRISIPKIGLTPKVVVQGVNLDQLERGPAHYPGTPLPGQKGNVALAGHRTTYGAPFHDVDQLENGDKIYVDTAYGGQFVYEVMNKPAGHQEVVQPDDVSVIQDKGDNRLTLTACHPKFSADQRLIIEAKLVGIPTPKLAGQDAVDKKMAKTLAAGKGEGKKGPAAIDNLDGKKASKTPMVLWGLLCAAIWLAAWVLARFVLGHKRPRPIRWSPYVLGTPFFLLALFFFFEHFVKLLPSNF